jgi:hypothetical protein
MARNAHPNVHGVWVRISVPNESCDWGPGRPDCKSLAATSKAKQNPNSVLQFRAKAIRTPANLIRLQDGLLSNDELQRAQIEQGHNRSSEETEGEVQSWTTTQPCLP